MKQAILIWRREASRRSTSDHLTAYACALVYSLALLATFATLRF